MDAPGIQASRVRCMMHGLMDTFDPCLRVRLFTPV